MKLITFIAYCTYGKGDSGESYVEVELTDEEYERVMTFGTKSDVFYNGFSNCEELKDVYDKVYAIAVDQMTEEMREFGDFDEDELEIINAPNWKIDDMYHCGVNFPWDFEDMLVDGDAY